MDKQKFTITKTVAIAHLKNLVSEVDKDDKQSKQERKEKLKILSEAFMASIEKGKGYTKILQEIMRYEENENLYSQKNITPKVVKTSLKALELINEDILEMTADEVVSLVRGQFGGRYF